MSPELNEEFKHLRVGMQFKPDIEDEATKAFQQIYTQVVSIEEAIEMLKRLKSSKNPREQQIFACMLRNLFDEYRFFPKYPDKELRITGILFGSLIQHQLVSFQMLGMTLRYVLEALRKPANTKMFKFGLYALQQFKLRLGEWPQVRQYYDTHHCSCSLTHSLARSLCCHSSSIARTCCRSHTCASSIPRWWPTSSPFLASRPLLYAAVAPSLPPYHSVAYSLTYSSTRRPWVRRMSPTLGCSRSYRLLRRHHPLLLPLSTEPALHRSLPHRRPHHRRLRQRLAAAVAAATLLPLSGLHRSAQRQARHPRVPRAPWPPPPRR